jgi:two-component system, NtrC family, nitrogen regulation sensor histidine kinase NtrY
MTTADEASPVALMTPARPSVVRRIIGPSAVGLALLSALVTFLVLAGLTPIAPTNQVVITLLAADGLTGLLLVVIIGREIWQIVQARRRGRAGARLHVRIVGLFSVIAAAPAVLVAIVASITLDRGLDRFFSTRTRAVIENSLMVSEAYVREHADLIRGDTIGMAHDLGRAKPMFEQDRERFRQVLTAQSSIRGLPAAMMLRGDRTIVDKSNLTPQLEFVLPTPAALANVNTEEPQVALIADGNYVAAIIKLKEYEDTFLYVARPLDPRVVSQLRDTRTSISQYAELETRRVGVQVAFALMFTVIALTVLLSAVWIGLSFANLLVAPIRRLIGAADLVSTGNLYVQVPVRPSEGDLAQLGETFNKMTQELRTQRDDLVHASEQIDSRRRFTEAVLAGASAGVIGVDADGQISIINRSAERLFDAGESDVVGRPLRDVLPELADMISGALAGGQRLIQGQFTLNRAGKERIVSVRVTTEQASDPQHGYVVTLDDITELVSAQRTSAWADVARRIAHEIKNPLTPIQLSAERLRRKYGKVITEDRGVFEQCTDTIIRQVDDIRRMVDEFSRFSRMPKPVMAMEDVADAVRQVVFLMRVGHADIDIEAEIATDPMPARFDRRLISQALTNIVKNAAEAISAVPPHSERGRILVHAGRVEDRIEIDVVDNGIGLPQENRSRLLEPYVTTREKGTGLGLAIVGKILEDHGGGIELRDASEKVPGTRGAWVRLTFAVEPVAATATAVDQTQPENTAG